ncbi:unnamed protein product, partial [Nesidiocoris tenuis]
MEEKSIGGSNYFLTIVDDFTRYTQVYFLCSKDEVFDRIREFITQAERETGLRLKAIRTDNGTEFVNQRVEKLLKSKGIKHQRSAVMVPQQNGVVERAQRSIVERARCMLADAGLPKCYWAEAVSTAVYLNNRSPTKSVKDMTPIEAWTGEKPDLSHLRIFGCEVMVKIPSKKRQKWDAKSKKMIFIGYCATTKCYRVIDPVSKAIEISRDVEFFEKKNTSNLEGCQTEKLHRPKPPIAKEKATSVDIRTLATAPARRPEQTEAETSPASSSADSEDGSASSITEKEEELPLETFYDFDEDSSDSEMENNVEPETPARKSSRKHRPKQFPDFVTYFASQPHDDVPMSAKQALSSPQAPEWSEAMAAELSSLEENDTYEWVDLPKGKRPLSMKWVFRLKPSEQNSIKFKARLVVRGCHQKEGIDYKDTFSPVIRNASLRYLFALAVKENLNIHHFDVTTAYLHGNLEEDIYVKPPEEAINSPGNKGKFWRLKKAVYGLKQSGRCWYQRLHEALVGLKLKQSKAEPCLYHRRTGSETVVIGVFVDDALILTKNEKTKNDIFDALRAQFAMKDLGEVKQFL